MSIVNGYYFGTDIMSPEADSNVKFITTEVGIGNYTTSVINDQADQNIKHLAYAVQGEETKSSLLDGYYDVSDPEGYVPTEQTPVLKEDTPVVEKSNSISIVPILLVILVIILIIKTFRK
jgi:hypothetical protein